MSEASRVHRAVHLLLLIMSAKPTPKKGAAPKKAAPRKTAAPKEAKPPVGEQIETAKKKPVPQPGSKIATGTEAVRQDKEARQLLDGVLQVVKGHQTTRQSGERSLAIQKIKEAIMWAGMDLKALREEGFGAPAPGATKDGSIYPESYNPDSPVIEPTADGLKM